MPLINCKIHLELNRTKYCVMSHNDDGIKFKTASTTLYVPMVTLWTEDNVKLTKQLNGEFKIPVYWNECKTKIESTNLSGQNPTRFYLDASFQGIPRLLFLVFDNTDNYAQK